MLHGKVAGLTVINSGEQGSPSQVYLHGISNFGDVRPLYIIDGVEGDIDNMNPYDIESIQVLKDAAAYSIYGVRGANGVIVFTTKKGKSGKAKLSYEFYVGHQQPLPKGPDLLNPQEQADLEWMAFKNSDRHHMILFLATGHHQFYLIISTQGLVWPYERRRQSGSIPLQY
jgi:TonB-dependent SusC/RagA subfamily outer membrane receptor